MGNVGSWQWVRCNPFIWHRLWSFCVTVDDVTSWNTAWNLKWRRKWCHMTRDCHDNIWHYSGFDISIWRHRGCVIIMRQGVTPPRDTPRVWHHPIVLREIKIKSDCMLCDSPTSSFVMWQLTERDCIIVEY